MVRRFEQPNAEFESGFFTGKSNRRNFLSTLTGSAVLLAGCAGHGADLSGMALRPGLGKLAEGRKLLYGSCSRGLIRTYNDGSPGFGTDSDYASLFAHECRLLTSEIEVKMPQVRPSENSWDFRAADLLLDFAAENHMAFRGHCLLWGQALPSWFRRAVTKENAAAFITGHIHKVCSRFAGKVHSWDVVNEAIAVAESSIDGLRNTPLLQLLGPQHLDVAFRAAYEADPHALLCLNDYSLEYDEPYHEKQRQAILRTLRRLLDAQVPVHALGVQSHLFPGRWKFSPEVVKAFFEEVASLGLQIFLSELDAPDRYAPADVGARDQTVAEEFRLYLEAALSVPAVTVVNSWGLSDRYSWVEDDDGIRREDGLPSRAQLFDRNLQPKPAYQAVAAVFGAPPA